VVKMPVDRSRASPGAFDLVHCKRLQGKLGGWAVTGNANFGTGQGRSIPSGWWRGSAADCAGDLRKPPTRAAKTTSRSAGEETG